MIGDASAAPLRNDPLRDESASPEVAQRSAAPSSSMEKLLDMPGVISSDAGNERMVAAPGPKELPSEPPSRRSLAVPATSADIVFYLISFGFVAIATIAVFFGTGFLLLVEPARGTLSGGLHDPGAHFLVHDPLPASSHAQRRAGGTLGTTAAQSEMPGSSEPTALSVVSVAPSPVTAESPRPEKSELTRNSKTSRTAAEVPKTIAEGNVPPSTEIPAEPPTAKSTKISPMQPSASSGDQRPADGMPGTIAAQLEVPGSAGTTASSGMSVTPPPPAADEPPPPGKNELAGNSTALPPTPEIPRNVAGGNIASRTDMPAEAPTAKLTSAAAKQSAAIAEPAPSSPATPLPASPSSHLSVAEVSDLVGQGDAHLRMGDVASARLFYERAAVAGDGRAALRLAATFDPNFLGRAGLRSVRGDAAEARLWYRRALNLGVAEAKNRLESLDTEQGR